jgi:hypothetical protein
MAAPAPIEETFRKVIIAAAAAPIERAVFALWHIDAAQLAFNSPARAGLLRPGPHFCSLRPT